MKRASDSAKSRTARGMMSNAFQFIALLATAAPLAAQHTTDFLVGQSGGQVAISPLGAVPGMVYHPLLRIDEGSFLRGWSHNNPGFDRVVSPAGGVSALPNGVSIGLEVDSLTPALLIIDASFNILESPGDSTILGGPNLHVHPTWFVDEDDPAFDQNRCVWVAALILFDNNSLLEDSQTFTVLLTNVSVRGGGFPPQNIPASGDFSGDGLVGPADHAALVECMNGPERRPEPNDPTITTCEVHCHNAHDFDDDLDIDLLDFAEFQVAFNP